MALPFLPADAIQYTYNQIDQEYLNLDLEETTLLKVLKFKMYVKRRWINQVTATELSLWDQKMVTNNGSESYHGRLKSLIKCCKPRIWNFLDTLNEIIIDTDNELARLKEGLQITRQRKIKNINNEERRNKCKEKLIGGSYTPLEHVRAISHTVGSLAKYSDPYNSDDSDAEDGDDEYIDTPQHSFPENRSLCAVCLTVRETTWIFLPCKHANCCGTCAGIIEQSEQRCPICRSPIEHTFEIFT